MALTSLLWLFLGFIVAFSFWYIVLGSNQLLRAQVETFCMINKPDNFNDCIVQHGIKEISKTNSFITAQEKLLRIFSNNVYVLIFTLIFSLIWGAGAIFVLAWNASVIAAAIGIFSKADITTIPFGILRYMIHGMPEIAAYFIGALAGGIISIAVIKHDTKTEKFWNILQDSFYLIVISILILIVAALIEVFITPAIF